MKILCDYLRKNPNAQSAVARHLNISPATVTMIKQGTRTAGGVLTERILAMVASKLRLQNNARGRKKQVVAKKVTRRSTEEKSRRKSLS